MNFSFGSCQYNLFFANKLFAISIATEDSIFHQFNHFFFQFFISLPQLPPTRIIDWELGVHLRNFLSAHAHPFSGRALVRVLGGFDVVGVVVVAVVVVLG